MTETHYLPLVLLFTLVLVWWWWLWTEYRWYKKSLLSERRWRAEYEQKLEASRPSDAMLEWVEHTPVQELINYLSVGMNVPDPVSMSLFHLYQLFTGGYPSAGDAEIQRVVCMFYRRLHPERNAADVTEAIQSMQATRSMHRFDGYFGPSKVRRWMCIPWIFHAGERVSGWFMWKRLQWVYGFVWVEYRGVAFLQYKPPGHKNQTPYVFIHGLGTYTSPMFRLEEWAKRKRSVIVPFHPQICLYGDRNITPNEYSDVLYSFLTDHLHLRKVHVMAHSYGNAVLRNFETSYPPVTSKLFIDHRILMETPILQPQMALMCYRLLRFGTFWETWRFIQRRTKSWWLPVVLGALLSSVHLRLLVYTAVPLEACTPSHWNSPRCTILQTKDDPFCTLGRHSSVRYDKAKEAWLEDTHGMWFLWILFFAYLAPDEDSLSASYKHDEASVVPIRETDDMFSLDFV